jgi:hypothetical protein
MAVRVKARNQFKYGPNLSGVKHGVKASFRATGDHPLLEAEPYPEEIFISGAKLDYKSKSSFLLGFAYGLQVETDPELDPTFGICFQTTLANND